MEDIKVGEFIRLKNGIIDKVEEIKGEDTYTLVFTKKNVYVLEWLLNNIEKHSTNIIDLIEVGDYVNGYLVVNVINGEYAPSGKCVDIDSSKQSEECTIWEDDIKSIVTKEMMKSVEYRVK